MYQQTDTVIWRSDNGLYDIEKRVVEDGEKRTIRYTLSAYNPRNGVFDRYSMYSSETGKYIERAGLPKYVRKAIQRVCFKTPVEEQPTL